MSSPHCHANRGWLRDTETTGSRWDSLKGRSSVLTTKGEIVKKPLASAAAALVFMFALAGCSVGTKTVSPSAVEPVIAQSLADSVGSDTLPNIDCGDDTIEAVVGNVFHCALSVDGDDATYDVAVTITAIDGSDLSFDSVVASEPN
jgi:hypothetical protein